jgi:PAS domain S-box-containing protein
MNRAQHVVSLVQAGDVRAGRAGFSTGTGELERILEQTGAIVGAARAELEQGSQQMERSARQLRLLAAIGGAGSVALLILAYLGLRRHIARQRRVEHTLRSLLEGAPDGTVIVREDGDIVLASAGLAALFGYSPAELIGKPVEMLLPERFRSGHAALRRRYFDAPRARTMGTGDEALFGRRRDGSEFAVEVSLSPVTTEEGVLVTAAVRDVTDHRRAEAQIGALNERLELRAGQLAATDRELDSFSYSVSHDLRTPLRAIDGFTRMLEEDYGDRLDEEGRRLLSVVLDNTRRMAAMIDELLEFSRLGRQPLHSTEVDMTALASEVLDELRASQACPGLQVDLQPLPPAWGDRVLLRQIWVNLLSNALKYSARRPDPRIDVSGRVRGDEHLYCVRDNGVGFDMQYADRLFGVFQRLHSAEEFPGAGVGLATVQRLVVRHGGVVWAEGYPGDGAAFHFALPRRQNESAVAP